jgi:hypothetical protein
MQLRMKYPVAVIKENDPAIYICNQAEWGLVSKGRGSFYEDGFIYDCDGNKYKLMGVLSKKKASFLISIKNFQPMYIVETKQDFIENINFLTFRNIMISHIEKHQSYWLSLDTFDFIKSKIENAKGFEEVLNFLRYGGKR